MKKTFLLTAIAASLAFCATHSQAQILSVNLTTDAANTNYTFTTADTAGAGTASTAGWNNISAGGNPSFATNTLTYNTGALSPISLTSNPNGSGAALTNLGGGTTGITKLFASGREASNSSSFPATFTFSNIPFALYNVYVYISATNPDRRSSFSLGATTFYAVTDRSNTTYDQAVSLVAGTYTPSNYVLFAGLTGATASLVVTSLSGNSTNFVGFQIENAATTGVPEPSTYAMLGLAGTLCVGVTLRRRRA